MVYKIPKCALDKYYEIIDSTITDMFGVVCQLAHIETVEIIDNSYDNIPDNRSVNPHRRPGGGEYRRNNKTIKEVEVLEDIKLKVYWDSKGWTRVGGNIAVPEAGLQTIFFATDLPKILRAKELIVHKEIKDLKEFRFKRFGEPFPMGIGHERWFGCFWE